jgi:phosphoglycolate phosphatase-like HAD superfamily hydrolase
MSLAFEEIFAIATPGHSDVAGRTDAGSWPTPPPRTGSRRTPRLARFRETYLRHPPSRSESSQTRKGLMPGVRELSTHSRRGRTPTSRWSRQLRVRARLKLEYFDLWKYFPCGAFGDAAHRNVLVPRALAAVEACGGPAFNAADTIVIGDTPLDIGCAAHVGARSLAIATGSHSVEELRAAGADVVLKDLSDTGHVLRVLLPEKARSA